eukprot:3345010-Amphidinium_carterae.1
MPLSKSRERVPPFIQMCIGQQSLFHLGRRICSIFIVWGMLELRELSLLLLPHEDLSQESLSSAMVVALVPRRVELPDFIYTDGLLGIQHVANFQ